MKTRNLKQLTKKDKILLGVLAGLIVIVIGVGVILIVNNTNAANEQTKKATSSTVSGAASSSSSNASSAVTDNTEKAKSSDNKSSDTKSNSSDGSTTSSKIKNTTPGYNSSGTSSKSSKSSSKSSKNKVKGDKVKRVVPRENTSHASNKTLKINGTTCYVGDTITIVLNITSQKSIVNYQGTVKYDTNYLKVKEVKSNDFGVANSNGSEILYNASAINGMNFSETGTVFTATFEVLKAGSTKVTDNMEIISELVNNNIKQLSPTDYTARLDIYK